jgi:hypothetical protein
MHEAEKNLHPGEIRTPRSSALLAETITTTQRRQGLAVRNYIQENCRLLCHVIQSCQIYLDTIYVPKCGKIYQITTTLFTKWP